MKRYQMGGMPEMTQQEMTPNTQGVSFADMYKEIRMKYDAEISRLEKKAETLQKRLEENPSDKIAENELKRIEQKIDALEQQEAAELEQLRADVEQNSQQFNPEEESQYSDMGQQIPPEMVQGQMPMDIFHGEQQIPMMQTGGDEGDYLYQGYTLPEAVVTAQRPYAGGADSVYRGHQNVYDAINENQFLNTLVGLTPVGDAIETAKLLDEISRVKEMPVAERKALEGKIGGLLVAAGITSAVTRGKGAGKITKALNRLIRGNGNEIAEVIMSNGEKLKVSQDDINKFNMSRNNGNSSAGNGEKTGYDYSDLRWTKGIEDKLKKVKDKTFNKSTLKNIKEYIGGPTIKSLYFPTANSWVETITSILSPKNVSLKWSDLKYPGEFYKREGYKTPWHKWIAPWTKTAATATTTIVGGIKLGKHLLDNSTEEKAAQIPVIKTDTTSKKDVDYNKTDSIELKNIEDKIQKTYDNAPDTLIYQSGGKKKMQASTTRNIYRNPYTENISVSKRKPIKENQIDNFNIFNDALLNDIDSYNFEKLKKEYESEPRLTLEGITKPVSYRISKPIDKLNIDESVLHNPIKKISGSVQPFESANVFSENENDIQTKKKLDLSDIDLSGIIGDSIQIGNTLAKMFDTTNRDLLEAQKQVSYSNSYVDLYNRENRAYNEQKRLNDINNSLEQIRIDRKRNRPDFRSLSQSAQYNIAEQQQRQDERSKLMQQKIANDAQTEQLFGSRANDAYKLMMAQELSNDNQRINDMRDYYRGLGQAHTNHLKLSDELANEFSTFFNERDKYGKFLEYENALKTAGFTEAQIETLKLLFGIQQTK